MCKDDLNDEIVSGDGCPIYCREADRIAADGHECIGPIIGDHDLCPKVGDLKRRDVEEVLAASWVRIEVGDDVGAEGEYERVVAIAALDGVVAARTVENVAALATAEHVLLAGSHEGLPSIAAGKDLAADVRDRDLNGLRLA